MIRWIPKIIVIGAILALGTWLVNYIYVYRPGTTAILNRQELRMINRLADFSIANPELSQEQRDKYASQFSSIRDEMLLATKGTDKRALYWPMVTIGTLHREFGDYEKAAEAYWYAHLLQPGAFVPFGSLADLYHHYVKDYQKAAEFYDQAIAIEGVNLDTYYGDFYDLYYYTLGDKKKAEELLISGVERYPKHTDILAFLARHYEREGEIDKAIARYEELREKYPESVVAAEGLSRLKRS